MKLGRPNIEKLKARADFAGLIEALDYRKDEEVREAAVAALAELEPASIEPLAEALKEPDWQSLSLRPGNAGKALAWIGAPAIEPLVAALADWSARDAARSALVQIGARAVEPLVAALRSGDFDLRLGAGDALQRIGAPAVEPLVAALGDGSEQMRADSAEVLGRIGDERALEALGGTLRDEGKAVRSAGARALEKLGWEPDAGEAGAAYWAEKGEWKRCARIGAAAVEPLIASLARGDEEARAGACAALGEIGDARAVEPLGTALAGKSKRVRRAAAKALGATGDARAIEPLVAALDDKTKEVRDAAATALEKLGWQAETTETGASFWVAKRDWSKCVELGAPAVEPLIAALNDKPSRPAVARALGEIGDPRALEPLVALLKDSDEKVREAATGALVAIGGASVEPLLAALSDTDAHVRLAAAAALGRIGDARAVAPLAAALEDKDGQLRREAARILLQIGDESVVEPLIAALRDGDVEVREAAARALRKIGDPRAEEPLLAMSKADRGDYRFTVDGAGVAIDFSCRSCGRPIAIRLADIAGSFTCRGCGKRIAIPSVTCYWAPECSGTYAECGGSIVKLPPEELAREEAAAWKDVSLEGARPTDDFRDEMGDIYRSIVTYRCTGCEARFTAAQGVAEHFSGSGQTKCKRVRCTGCGRTPPWDQLPRLG